MFREGEYKINQPEPHQPTYYEILGVAPDATAEEILQAFRRLSKENHPDHGGDTETYQRISEAYTNVKDPDSRQKYDRTISINGPQSRAVPETRTEQYSARAEAGRGQGLAGQKGQDFVRPFDSFEARRERLKKEEERRERVEKLMRDLAARQSKGGQEPDNGRYARVTETPAAANASQEPEKKEASAELSELTIKKIGAYYYLVDSTGREQSSPYDKIEERDGFLIGKLLSKEWLLDRQTGHALSRGYNKIFTRNGLLIGRDSLYEYLLDPETGQDLSMVGYEKISKRGEKIFGEISGREEEIKIHEKHSETHRYSAVG